MILTKEEFQEQFEFNSAAGVCRLIREKKIKLNEKGLIDTDEEPNASYCQKRKERLKNANLKNKKNKKEEKPAKNYKSADQLALEIDYLNARLDEKQQRSALIKLKIAKEQKEVIETDVLNRCIQTIFADMIKNLTELPSIYAADLIKIAQTEEKPKEIIVEFLTQKITSNIKKGLESAKTAAKKYYEGEAGAETTTR